MNAVTVVFDVIGEPTDEFGSRRYHLKRMA